MIWRSLYSREKILKSFWCDVLEKVWSFLKRKDRERYDLKIWEKFVFKRKDTKNFIIWWRGRSLFSSEKILQAFFICSRGRSIFFQEKRYWKFYDLMIWNNLLFKRIHTEKVTIWWLGRSLFQEKGTGKAMIWQVGRSLFSKEEIIKSVCFDDLEKLIIERKHTEIFRTRCLEKGLFQKERYRERCDMMISRKNFFKRTDSKKFFISWFGEANFQEKRYWNPSDRMLWKKFIFNRKDTENVLIWWLGRSLFSNEKYSKRFWSDDVEEVFQENRY